MKILTRYFLLPLFFLVGVSGCRDSHPADYQGSSVLQRGQVRHLDRFEQEIQAFELVDKKSMPPGGSILFVGSSSIRMWKTLEKDFAPLPVINRGFGGATIAEVNYYAERIVYKYSPGVIVFYCGENDIAEGLPPAVVFQDFKKFMGETEKNLPEVPVVYISAKPSPARWDYWRKFKILNQMIEKFAQNRPSLYFVDIGPVLSGLDGKPDPALFIEDGLHLNRAGYDRWVQVLRPMVEELYEAKMAQ